MKFDSLKTSVSLEFMIILQKLITTLMMGKVVRVNMSQTTRAQCRDHVYPVPCKRGLKEPGDHICRPHKRIYLKFFCSGTPK